MLQHVRTDDIVKRAVSEREILAISRDERPVCDDAAATLFVVFYEFIAQDICAGLWIVAAPYL